MRPLQVMIGFSVATIALSATIWAARYASWVKPQQAPAAPIAGLLRDTKVAAARQPATKSENAEGAAKGLHPTSDSRPSIAERAPFPKAVIGEPIYKFGSAGINEEKKHTFRIENKGQAPLAIAKGPTECNCTISNLSGHEIPPGGSADVEIVWAPRAADPAFEKTVIIWTNDPDRSEIHFQVIGKVVPFVAASPTAWHAGTVTDDRDGQVTGTVTSECVDNFKIVSVEPSDPQIKVEYKPLSQRELARANKRAAYEFTVTVGKGIRLGRFRSRLTILTTLEKHRTLEVDVTALRTGPIAFLPAIPIVGRASWSSEQLLLNLGSFPHRTGSKAAVPALVYAMKDKFQVLDVKSSDRFVKVSLEPNPQIGGDQRQGVRFVFEIPPGSPAVTRLGKNPTHVTVNTNHPTLKDIDFDLAFVSQ